MQTSSGQSFFIEKSGIYIKMKTGFNFKIGNYCCCSGNLYLLSVILILYFSFSVQTAFSQTELGKLTSLKEEKDSIVPFKDRISFRTNTVDWILTMPNVAFELDLSGSPYNRVAIALSAKGNWPNCHYSSPRLVYDMYNVKLELKKYGRTSARFESGDGKRSFGEVLSDMFNLRVKNPNFWRAYYWGLYVDMGGYNIKFSETGHYGQYLGFGLTLGYGIPLIQYKRGALDLELGANIGAVYTKCNSYQYDNDGNRIDNEPESVKKFLPYPVLSELRVALVYRFSSIKNKYKLSDPDRLARKAERRRIKDEANAARLMMKSQQNLEENN